MSAPSVQSLSFPEYFKQLSTSYARSTGDSTYQVISSVLREIPLPISASSVIHDNASGPGTATLAVLAHLKEHPARIEGTDSSAPMIDAFNGIIDGSHMKNVQATVMDSHELTFADATFDISITNISASTFKDPMKALKEVHRTLKPGGVAVVTQWKRFTVAEIIHKAQMAIRPDSKLFNIPKAEFMQDGYLRDMLIDAGFDASRVQQRCVKASIYGEAIQGVREFMVGNFTASARNGWTEEEIAQWPAAIDNAIEQERAAHGGGIEFESWAVVAIR